MSSAVHSEQVLVVPTELFHRLGYFQGFSANIEQYLEALFDPSHTEYRPRGEVEQDPSFKQLIPYVIFRHDDAERGVQLFEYTRGAGQGEARLRRKRSVGVGGHISACDAKEQRPYEDGMQRELNEEVHLTAPYRGRCVGLINDDQTDVGRVHLGVVHVFEMDEPGVAARESDIQEAGFRELAVLKQHHELFESWSQICLEALFPEVFSG